MDWPLPNPLLMAWSLVEKVIFAASLIDQSVSQLDKLTTEISEWLTDEKKGKEFTQFFA